EVVLIECFQHVEAAAGSEPDVDEDQIRLQYEHVADRSLRFSGAAVHFRTCGLHGRCEKFLDERGVLDDVDLKRMSGFADNGFAHDALLHSTRTPSTCLPG